jgi:DHA2 family multidrug resistance protein-like MFS transporter
MYRSTMASASLPGIPTHTIAAVRDTLGAAVAEAQHLTGDAATELIDLAGSAFTTALEFAAVASAGLVLVTAFSMVVLARRSQSARRAAGQCAVCGA